jgi:hypothetical protein
VRHGSVFRWRDDKIVAALDKFYSTVKDKVGQISVDDIVGAAFDELNKLPGNSGTNLLGDAENTKKLKSQFATLVKDKIKIESKNLNHNSYGVLLVPPTMTMDEWERINVEETIDI